ncbi:hypothetical protein OH76DRAFT_574022 [Lentinus brumalis]|uniref:HAT C-terminal dimerisation domain-containing protein n=1 Tax=Lentinus brumalis TaxID=2498619 RepID=A0A371DTI4_9APHY|nr:hypothetical protein OH76DRAFT_574022 [Polyporus brumalis]
MLDMLRTEYEVKCSPIANLSKPQANKILKVQVALFVKSEWPFDRPVYPGQSPYDWWTALDESKTTNVTLQFLCRSLFALIPNSMVDERTQSSYTWMNSYLRNRQHVATVTRMIKIRNYCKYQADKPSPTRRPTVKFREMKGVIFGTSQPGSTSKVPTPAGRLPGSALAGNPVAEVPEDEVSDGESEDEMDDDSSDDEVDTFAADLWEVERLLEQLDLEAPLLRDQLSDKPVEVPKAGKGKEKTRMMPPSEPSSETVLTDADWEMD